jgi:uncharacterized protein (DUF1330 family)
MSAYIIANVKVTNETQYEEYRAYSKLAIRTHGAEVCVRSGQAEVLEGDWAPERLVLLKFPSVEHARAFYHSTEYTNARAARAGAAITNMVVVEGSD